MSKPICSRRIVAFAVVSVVLAGRGNAQEVPLADHHQHLFSPAVVAREGWAAFRQLPLTADEFRTIAGNVPPYMN